MNTNFEPNAEELRRFKETFQRLRESNAENLAKAAIEKARVRDVWMGWAVLKGAK